MEFIKTDGCKLKNLTRYRFTVYCIPIIVTTLSWLIVIYPMFYLNDACIRMKMPADEIKICHDIMPSVSIIMGIVIAISITAIMKFSLVKKPEEWKND